MRIPVSSYCDLWRYFGSANQLLTQRAYLRAQKGSDCAHLRRPHPPHGGTMSVTDCAFSYFSGDLPFSRCYCQVTPLLDKSKTYVSNQIDAYGDF